MTDEMLDRLQRLLPVSWDYDTDGHGEPTHAVLTFGEHQTQAITMCPDDFMALNNIADRLSSLEEEKRVLVEEAVALFRAFCRGMEAGPSRWSAEDSEHSIDAFRTALSAGVGR